MRTMIWIASSLLIVLTSCGEGETKSKPVESSAITQTEVPETQTTTVSTRYKNGINEKNKGDKTGKIKLHGTIPTKGTSYLYLYQTEARTKTLIDSTKIIDGNYSFNNVEVSRGFYELILDNKPKNNCTIILNPDETDVIINFSSSRINVSKVSPNSKENKAWFAYQSAENKNKNEIKNLRKGMKDSPYKRRIEEQIKSKVL